MSEDHDNEDFEDEAPVSNDKVDTIRSRSSGTIGRAFSHTRGQQVVLDSSSHPKADALTNSEAFLAAVSSCGVTLIEDYAKNERIPIEETEVTIQGVRLASDTTRFDRISLNFAFAGLSQEQAESLVQIWRER